VISQAPQSEAFAQARQRLQQAVDNVAGAVKEQVAPSDSTAAAAETHLLEGEPQEEIDPRFAGLLNLRRFAQTNTNGEVTKGKGLQVSMPAQTGAVTSVAAEGFQSEGELQLQGQPTTLGQGQLGAQHASPTLSQLNAQQPNLVAGPAQAPFDGARATVPQVSVTLPSGHQVSESQIFDQVVTHISGSASGETGRMIVRLNPAELGSLRLDLQVEGDKVRANLHAQTQQVQEVIERNLPQLRNALAEQGLKIDQFEVEVDQHQTREEYSGQQESEQRRFANTPDRTLEEGIENRAIPLDHLINNSGVGISVHA
jgi:flagellar hook-length control protein FliK